MLGCNSPLKPPTSQTPAPTGSSYTRSSDASGWHKTPSFSTLPRMRRRTERAHSGCRGCRRSPWYPQVIATTRGRRSPYRRASPPAAGLSGGGSTHSSNQKNGERVSKPAPNVRLVPPRAAVISYFPNAAGGLDSRRVSIRATPPCCQPAGETTCPGRSTELPTGCMFFILISGAVFRGDVRVTRHNIL